MKTLSRAELINLAKWFVEADNNGEIEHGPFATRGLKVAREVLDQEKKITKGKNEDWI